MLSLATPYIPSSPSLRCSFDECRRGFYKPVSPYLRAFKWPARPRSRRNEQVCCGGDDIDKQDEGWTIEERVEKMLTDPESKALLLDLNAAVERVAKAKRDLDALEEQQRLSSVTDCLAAAEALVEECQRDVFAAEAEAKNAEIALIKARAGSSLWDMSDTKWADGQGIDEDAERLESGKAAAISGVVGTLAGIPFFLPSALDGAELATSAGVVLVSCAVFGLTYRYAVRRDLRNTQLKAGCVAAFSLVRGLGQVEAARLLFSPLLDVVDQLSQGFVIVTESIAIFAFAAVLLEYCFQIGLLSPFPLKQP